MLQLRLEQAQVHVGRTFERARAARKAIAQGRVQLGGLQSVIIFQSARFQRGANDIRPPARGHDFLAGRNVSRAHRRRLFQAHAAAVALLEVPQKRFVPGAERQHRLKRQRRFRARAQIGIHLESPVADDFSGIEQMMRVERVLDLRHQAHQQLRPQRVAPPGNFRARDAHAVFGGNRPAKLLHQRRNFRRDVPEFFHVLARMQVEQGPHVQQARARMAVIRRFQPHPLHHRLQRVHIGGQLLRPHRRVFDARDGLHPCPCGRSAARAPRLAQLPDQIRARLCLQDFFAIL